MGTPPATPQIPCATVNQSSLPCLQWPVSRSHSLTMWRKSPGRWWDVAAFCCGIPEFHMGKTHENPGSNPEMSLFFNLFKTIFLSILFSGALDHVLGGSAYAFTICIPVLLTKAWWQRTWVLDWKKLKDLCLQVSKHIKLILFLNYLTTIWLIELVVPSPKSASPTFSLIHSHQSCFAVDVSPERALRPAQSTSRPAETTPQRSGWFSLVCTVNLSGRSIHSQKEVFKLGLQNCLILGRNLGIVW